MVELERRDKLAQPQDEHAGECFIAYRTGDKVCTLSGIADHFEVEHEMDTGSFWFDNVAYSQLLNFGHTVTIHFSGNLVEEVRPFGGEG